MDQKLSTLINIFTTLRSLPDVTRGRRVVAYEVTGPTTVYVRASHCHVIVRRTMESQVQVEGDLRQAFGWQWVTERDDAGIYIVLKRKPLVGALSYATLDILVPADAYLVFNLTPGSVQLANFEGRLSVAPLDNTLIKAVSGDEEALEAQ